MPERLAGAERRRCPRRPAEGTIRLWAEPLYRVPVEAVLVDVSDSGFRARHHDATLAAGRIIRWEAQSGSPGVARVVWTRVFGDLVESGFVLIRGGEKERAPLD